MNDTKAFKKTFRKTVIVTVAGIASAIAVVLSSCSRFTGYSPGNYSANERTQAGENNEINGENRENIEEVSEKAENKAENKTEDKVENKVKNKTVGNEVQKREIINPEGATIKGRFQPPEGFTRVEAEEDSFGAYLRNLPLKPHGSKVKYYNGKTKPKNVHEAVIDIDVGDRDLQQCADAVMRLRAEYLYARKMYDKIHFNFVNGFKADYVSWMNGNRIVVKGNDAYWVKQADYSDSYETFRKYMDMVFAYANTESLEKEMRNIGLEDMQIGDVFLKGSLPGHCVIIVDMAENEETGEKLFMIAQSYMPAQDIHILKNEKERDISPWYSLNFGEKLITPEWEFTRNQLYRFVQ